MLPSAKQVAEALKPKLLIFGLTIHNIPTINLRRQYAHDRSIVFDQALADTIHEWKFGRTHGASVNYPEPDPYFSMLLRSTIVGIECTLQNLAIEELAFSNRLTKAVYHAIHNPSTFGKSMVEAYYNKIPEHVGVNACLKKHDNALWRTVQQFYREIRNPLSHGYQLSDVKAESLRAVFGMFDQIFGWIDSWSDPLRIEKILRSTTFRVLK